MGSLIGLKNMLILSAVLFTIGSVSAQQAYAGLLCDCTSQSNEEWSSAFECLEMGVPQPDDVVCIADHDVKLNEETEVETVEIIEGSLTIGCDGDRTVGGFGNHDRLINHGAIDIGFLLNTGSIQNSSSAFTYDNLINQGTFENISTICTDVPVGGTVGSLDTVSLLVAGAQANMGLWSLALVGIIGAGAAITYKVKSKKTGK